MTGLCEYAACPLPGPHLADGFRFCTGHLREHQREQGQTPTVSPAPRIQRRRGEPQPCGSHASFNRHKARGEDPCFPCALAERLYQRRRPDRRAGARRRAS